MRTRLADRILYYYKLYIAHIQTPKQTSRSYNIWSDPGIEPERISLTHYRCATEAFIYFQWINSMCNTNKKTVYKNRSNKHPALTVTTVFVILCYENWRELALNCPDAIIVSAERRPQSTTWPSNRSCDTCIQSLSSVLYDNLMYIEPALFHDNFTNYILNR